MSNGTGVLGVTPNPTQPGGGGGEEAIFSNVKTITISYTITDNTNSASYGPITIGSSATVTIPSSATWTVI